MSELRSVCPRVFDDLLEAQKFVAEHPEDAADLLLSLSHYIAQVRVDSLGAAASSDEVKKVYNAVYKKHCEVGQIGNNIVYQADMLQVWLADFAYRSQAMTKMSMAFTRSLSELSHQAHDMKLHSLQMTETSAGLIRSLHAPQEEIDLGGERSAEVSFLTETGWSGACPVAMLNASLAMAIPIQDVGIGQEGTEEVAMVEDVRNADGGSQFGEAVGASAEA
jgi:hypothetical protein